MLGNWSNLDSSTIDVDLNGVGPDWGLPRERIISENAPGRQYAQAINPLTTSRD